MVCVASCNKDTPPDYAELIIGTWKSDKPFTPGDPASYNYKKYTAKAAAPVGLSGEHREGSDWTIGETTEHQAGTEFYYRIADNQLYEHHPTGVTGGELYTSFTYTIRTLTATKLVYVEEKFHSEYTFFKQ